MMVSGNPTILVKSTDYGATFTNVQMPFACDKVVCNSVGDILYTVGSDATVYVSTDYGVTWNATALTTATNQYRLTCDGPGNRVIATNDNVVFITTDMGATWTTYDLLGDVISNGEGWGDFSISPDGTKYFISAGRGGTYHKSMGSPDVYVPPPPPPPVPCFLEGTPILCVVNGVETYVSVESLRPGTLVKTSMNGYKKVTHVGYRPMINNGLIERNPNSLYLCTKAKFPELLSDITITGLHAILVDDITPKQKEGIFETLGRIFITDRKYRLPACVDERATPIQTAGKFTVWHFALENADIKMNYGVYANGLLVESSPIHHMVTKKYTLVL
jgi:hypothetical protein